MSETVRPSSHVIDNDHTSRMSRRNVLGAALAGGFLASCSPLPPRPGNLRRRDIALGVQLYTVGEAARTDLRGTFRRLAEIGFETVELAGFHGHTASELRASAVEAGLRLQSIHLPLRGSEGALGLDGDIPRLAASLNQLGIGDIVVPMVDVPDTLSQDAATPFGERLLAALTPDHWRRLASALNERAALLRREGLRLGYHNHNMEFALLGRTSGWEILLAETDPQLVTFELDVGWVAAAGLDPVATLARHGTRIRQLHLKDIRPSTAPNYALRQDPAEAGSGVVDWPRLLAAAHAAGVGGYYVEQEPPYPAGPFEALAKSYGCLATLT